MISPILQTDVPAESESRHVPNPSAAALPGVNPWSAVVANVPADALDSWVRWLQRPAADVACTAPCLCNRGPEQT